MKNFNLYHYLFLGQLSVLIVQDFLGRIEKHEAKIIFCFLAFWLLLAEIRNIYLKGLK